MFFSKMLRKIEAYHRLQRINAKKKKPNGFATLEVIVAIAVVAIITFAMATELHGFLNGGKAAALKQNVFSLMNVAHSYASTTAGQVGGDYNGLTAYTSSGYIAGTTSLLPESYTPSGLPNPFGGYGILETTPGNPYTYTIIETGLPPDVCEQTATAFAYHAQATCSGNTLTVVSQ